MAYFPHIIDRPTNKYVATPCHGCGQVNYTYKPHDRAPRLRIAMCMTCGTEQVLNLRHKIKEAKP